MVLICFLPNNHRTSLLRDIINHYILKCNILDRSGSGATRRILGNRKPRTVTIHLATAGFKQIGRIFHNHTILYRAITYSCTSICPALGTNNNSPCIIRPNQIILYTNIPGCRHRKGIHLQSNAVVVCTYETILNRSIRHTTQVNTVSIQYPTQDINVVNHHMVGVINRQCPIGGINNSNAGNRKIASVGQPVGIRLYQQGTVCIGLSCMSQFGTGQDSASRNGHMAAGDCNLTIYNRSFIYIQRFSFFQCNPLRIMFTRTIILHTCGQIIRVGTVRIRTIRQYHQIVEPVTVKLHRHFPLFPLRQSKLNRVVPHIDRSDSIHTRTNFHTAEAFLLLHSDFDRCVKVMRKVHKTHRIP